ncbi:hypothetical protein TNCV_2423241 [Trichonephila clavipes]|nr:hypothetical protein TNCV_2423241 [Trichonephila clavipes]
MDAVEINCPKVLVALASSSPTLDQWRNGEHLGPLQSLGAYCPPLPTELVCGNIPTGKYVTTRGIQRSRLLCLPDYIAALACLFFRPIVYQTRLVDDWRMTTPLYWVNLGNVRR